MIHSALFRLTPILAILMISIGQNNLKVATPLQLFFYYCHQFDLFSF